MKNVCYRCTAETIGFGVWLLVVRFRCLGLEFNVRDFKVFGFTVSGFGLMEGMVRVSGFRVFGFRVSGFEFGLWVQGVAFRE